jgi:hypothetical protein
MLQISDDAMKAVMQPVLPCSSVEPRAHTELIFRLRGFFGL